MLRVNQGVAEVDAYIWLDATRTESFLAVPEAYATIPLRGTTHHTMALHAYQQLNLPLNTILRYDVTVQRTSGGISIATKGNGIRLALPPEHPAFSLFDFLLKQCGL